MKRMTKGEVRTFRFDFTTAAGSAYDLTGYELIEVIFTKPDGTQVKKAATLNGAATGGSFEYTAPKDEINAVGPWRAWGHFEIGDPVTDAKYSEDPIQVYVQEAP